MKPSSNTFGFTWLYMYILLKHMQALYTIHLSTCIHYDECIVDMAVHTALYSVLIQCTT